MREPRFFPRADLAPFSAAVQVGNIYYLSGQIGIDSQGQLVAGFEPQVRQTMENIRAVLLARNLSMSDIFKCTIMLAEARSLTAALAYIKRLQQMPAVRNALLKSHEIQTKEPERPVRVQITADWSQQS